jgi:hypothetical protein
MSSYRSPHQSNFLLWQSLITPHCWDRNSFSNTQTKHIIFIPKNALFLIFIYLVECLYLFSSFFTEYQIKLNIPKLITLVVFLFFIQVLLLNPNYLLLKSCKMFRWISGITIVHYSSPSLILHTTAWLILLEQTTDHIIFLLKYPMSLLPDVYPFPRTHYLSGNRSGNRYNSGSTLQYHFWDPPSYFPTEKGPPLYTPLLHCTATSI